MRPPSRHCPASRMPASAHGQKLLLEADDDKFDAVLKDAVKTAKKVEPDFEIEL